MFNCDFSAVLPTHLYSSIIILSTSATAVQDVGHHPVEMSEAEGTQRPNSEFACLLCVLGSMHFEAADVIGLAKSCPSSTAVPEYSRLKCLLVLSRFRACIG